jgi:hypothetical protein
MRERVDGQPAVYPFRTIHTLKSFSSNSSKFMTFRTVSYTFARCARAGFPKARLVSFLFLLVLSVYTSAQSTPAKLPSTESAAPKLEPPHTPEEVHNLELKLTEHEDWTKLSIKDLGLQTNPPLPGGTLDRPQFTRELVRLQWRPSDPVDVYISMPKGVKKPRVVLYLYGYPSDASRLTSDDWCAAATKGGFAAVGFVPALTGERFHAPWLMKQWFVSELQASLAISTHDVQMILTWIEWQCMHKVRAQPSASWPLPSIHEFRFSICSIPGAIGQTGSSSLHGFPRMSVLTMCARNSWRKLRRSIQCKFCLS